MFIFFRPHENEKPAFSNSSVFVKISVVNGGPNRRNKAAFSNFSGVLWRLPETNVEGV